MEKRSTSQPPQSWTILKLLRWTTSYFTKHQVENPRASAEILLAHTLGYQRIDLYIRYEQPLTKQELATFKSYIQRRVKREPTAYIVGSKEFWSKNFAVTFDVLIPRPETECLVETVLAGLKSWNPEKPKRILELGTGSGAIAVAIASERPMDQVFASDISFKAIQIAQQNARNHQIDNRILFFLSDWFEALNQAQTCMDMIVSNPPYIPTHVIDTLQPEIRLYEPRISLDGGIDGLSAIRHIIQYSYDYLVDNGRLVLEIGHDQKKKIEAFVIDFKRYKSIRFIKDYSGYDRIVELIK